jgi:hypothetical protein
MIMAYYTFKVQFGLSKSPFLFKSLLLAFFGFFVVYNIFGFDYYWLFRVSYTLLIFFPFYYAAYNRFLTEKKFYLLGFVPLAVKLYGLYVSFFLRGELGKEYFEIADNTGYALLSLFIYFSLRPEKTFNVYLLSAIFIAVLFSFKRGAILSGAIAYGAFTLYNFRNLIARKILILPLLFGLLSIGYVAFEYADKILYRFIYDTGAGAGAGSGRVGMYPQMFQTWIESDAIGIVFGRGFFSITDLPGGHYAHSDWLELIYDHGLMGVIVYSVLIISFLATKKYVSREMMPAYIAIVSVWILKSLFSGVYMDRGFSLFFACLGLLLGSAHREKEGDTSASSIPNKNVFRNVMSYDPRRLYRIPH